MPMPAGMSDLCGLGAANLMDGLGAQIVDFPPLIGNLLGWYDFSDSTLLYTLSTHLVHVASDADPIGYVTDKSPAGNNLSQATSGARLVWKTAIQNGLAIARFDGVAQFMTGLPDLAAAYTQVAAVNTKAPTTAKSMTNFCNSSGTAADYGWEFAATTSKRQGAVWHGTVINEGTNNLTNAFNTLTMLRSGSSSNWTSTFYIDTTVDKTTTGIATNPNAASATGTLGQVASVRFFGGDLGELLMYNVALGASDLSIVQAYLKNKWGTP